jgi:hypothetical protein
LLLNPKNPTIESQAKTLTSAAASRGLRIEIIKASSNKDIATLAIPDETEALIVAPVGTPKSSIRWRSEGYPRSTRRASIPKPAA